MIKQGDCIKVKTKTQDDMFGTCIYQVCETGLPSPEKGRDEDDGVACVMLTGTGPSARPGMKIRDSQAKIQSDIENGITQVISHEEAEKELQKEEGGGKGNTGCIEYE